MIKVNKIIFNFIFVVINLFPQNLFAEALSPWDRGVESEDIRQEEYDKDLGIIEAYYEDCGEQTEIPQTKCLNIAYNHNIQWSDELHFILDIAIWQPFCAHLPQDYPYVEYWMAFQKGEQAQVPYSTAFIVKPSILQMMKDTEGILYGAAPSLLVGTADSPGVIKRLNKASAAHGWGIDIKDDQLEATAKEVISELKKFDLVEQRFRNAIPKSGGYRYMVGHIFTTRLHETYAKEKKYNQFPDPTDKKNPSWVHYGAKNAGEWSTLSASGLFALGSMGMLTGQGDHPKPPIPDWLSEMPLGSGFSGMILNNFYGPNLKVFKDMMLPEDGPGNCMAMRMARSSGGTMNDPKLPMDATPNDILSAEHLQKLDANNPMRKQYQYCLPGMHGSKFSSPMSIVDTWYGTVADNVAFYRNLRAAYRLGNQFLAGEFHDLQEVTEGDHKRDRIQFLGEPVGGGKWQGGRKGEVFKGCSPFKAYDHFIPDLSGPQYGVANDYKDNPEGEYFRSVHWRYVRGCPFAGNAGFSCYYPAQDSGGGGGHNHSVSATTYDFILK